MRVLFLFLDGIGLAPDDPGTNPFALTSMPNLQNLIGGSRMVSGTAPYHGARASLISLDTCLGVKGMPQSATGQAVLLTGRNIPAEIGYHYGPWPDQAVAAHVKNGNLFGILKKEGYRAGFLNAYPPSYFRAVQSGKRLYSSIPLAVTSAGIELKTAQDLNAGQAISADLTAEGWRERLDLPETPILTPGEAGLRLADLARLHDFAFFEYWLSDYAGHEQDMGTAVRLLETIDLVLGSLVAAWDDREGLILLTSDHGNLEDLSTRRHTTNPVPCLMVGAPELRREFTTGLSDLTGIAPAIVRVILE